MPRIIEEGFRDFHSRLSTSAPESEAAKNHRASIEASLRASFGMISFFRMGSFGNGTNISGYSDVDYFAVIQSERLDQNSTIALAQVRDVLDRRFPRTDVRVNCPAVRIPFGGTAADMTEVVPALPAALSQNKSIIYNIPNCSSAWMHSGPDIHNAYVEMVNKKFGGKVKPLIRFVKAWKYYQNVPILSFYLELWVACYADTQKSIVYSIDLTAIFQKLSSSGLAALIDPTGISGLIRPCNTQAQLEESQSNVNMASIRAAYAWEAEQKGKISDAFDWWNRLYNGNFPSFY